MKLSCKMRCNSGDYSALMVKCLALLSISAHIVCGVFFTLGLIFFKDVCNGNGTFGFLIGGLAGQALLIGLWCKLRPNLSWFLFKISGICVGIFGVKVFLDGIYALWLSGGGLFYCMQALLGCLIVFIASLLINMEEKS